MAEPRCYYCEGVVRDESEGGICDCQTGFHFKCLEKHGLLEQSSGGLLSSGSTYVKCPSCHTEHKI